MPIYARKTSVLFFLIVASISALILFGAPFFGNILVVDMPLQHADAIVVMGGDRFEKLPVAADLLKNGMAPRILLTNDGVFAGWSKKKQRNLYQVEWAEEELLGFGVPREDIIKLPFYGSSTMFDALAVKRYLVESGLKKIIVVTSDYHTRRTYWTFRHVLKDYPSDISVIPATSIGIGTKDIAVEYAKYLYYILRYGLLNMETDMNDIVTKKSIN